MLTLNNYIEKTSTGEVKFKEGAFEGNEFILYIENGDLTPLVYLYYSELKGDLFILNLPNSDRLENFKICLSLKENKNINFISFDNDIMQTISEEGHKNIKNLLPNFSPYLDKESAILFLNEEDKERYVIDYKIFDLEYIKIYHLRGDGLVGFEQKEYNEGIKANVLNNGIGNFTLIDDKKLTIITNSIHAENINQINETCKELKEKYGVEYIELVAPHCHIKKYLISGSPGSLNLKWFNSKEKYYNYFKTKTNLDEGCIKRTIEEHWNINHTIDKIITTNSTRILEPQESQNLEVINCEEFF